MSLMDLECKESIYMAQGGCYNAKDKKHLLLGEVCRNQYFIYLFFPLPSCMCIRHLKQARLILFKMPQEDRAYSGANEVGGQYYVGPLVDFFSIYSDQYGGLVIEDSQVVIFKDTYCCSYTDIDITSIVKSWLEEKIENKGLLLYGSRDASLLTYASSRYSIEGMRPRIRLVYENFDECPILSSTPATIIVK